MSTVGGLVDPPSLPPAPAPTPIPPPVWPVFVGFILAFFAISIGASIPLFVAMVTHVVQQGSGALKDPTSFVREILMVPWVLVSSMTISTLGLGIAALVGAKLSGQPISVRLRAGPAGFPIANVALVLVAVLCVGQFAMSLVERAGAYQGSMLERLSGVARDMPLGWFLALLLVGSVGAGLAEELFFRGFMQTRLRERYGAWTAIWVTASFFGLLHADVIHTPLAFLVGLVLGWGAELRGNIRPCIAAHALNNLTSFLLSRYAFGLDANLPAWTLALVAVVGCGAFAGGWALNRPATLVTR